MSIFKPIQNVMFSILLLSLSLSAYSAGDDALAVDPRPDRGGLNQVVVAHISKTQSPDTPIKVTLINFYCDDYGNFQNEDGTINKENVLHYSLGRKLGHSEVSFVDTTDEDTEIRHVSWPEGDTNRRMAFLVEDPDHNKGSKIEVVEFYISAQRFDSFDRWYRQSQFIYNNDALQKLLSTRTQLGRSLREYLNIVDEDSKKELFAFLNTYDPNDPTDPPNWENVGYFYKSTVRGLLKEYAENRDDITEAKRTANIDGDTHIFLKRVQENSYQQLRTLSGIGKLSLESKITRYGSDNPENLWRHLPVYEEFNTHFTQWTKYDKKTKKTPLNANLKTDADLRNLRKQVLANQLKNQLNLPVTTNVEDYVRLSANPWKSSDTYKMMSYSEWVKGSERQKAVHKNLLEFQQILQYEVEEQIQSTIDLHPHKYDKLAYYLRINGDKSFTIGNRFAQFRINLKKYRGATLKLELTKVKYGKNFKIHGYTGWACVDVATECMRKVLGNENFYRRYGYPRDPHTILGKLSSELDRIENPNILSSFLGYFGI